MRQASPLPTRALPLTNADQRRLAALLEQLRDASPIADQERDPVDPVAVLSRLVAALPALRGRLPPEQQQLLGELDQSEESLDTSGDLALFEEAVTQLAQAATESALRAGQRRAVLMRAGDDR